MWFRETETETYNHRPYRTCQVCGHPAPRDAIRLKGGRFYCPQGECRRVAERSIHEARGRLEGAPVAS